MSTCMNEVYVTINCPELQGTSSSFTRVKLQFWSNRIRNIIYVLCSHNPGICPGGGNLTALYTCIMFPDYFVCCCFMQSIINLSFTGSYCKLVIFSFMFRIHHGWSTGWNSPKTREDGKPRVCCYRAEDKDWETQDNLWNFKSWTSTATRCEL